MSPVSHPWSRWWLLVGEWEAPGLWHVLLFPGRLNAHDYQLFYLSARQNVEQRAQANLAALAGAPVGRL